MSRTFLWRGGGAGDAQARKVWQEVSSRATRLPSLLCLLWLRDRLPLYCASWPGAGFLGGWRCRGPAAKGKLARGDASWNGLPQGLLHRRSANRGAPCRVKWSLWAHGQPAEQDSARHASTVTASHVQAGALTTGMQQGRGLTSCGAPAGAVAHHPCLADASRGGWLAAGAANQRAGLVAWRPRGSAAAATGGVQRVWLPPPWRTLVLPWKLTGAQQCLQLASEVPCRRLSLSAFAQRHEETSIASIDLECTHETAGRRAESIARRHIKFCQQGIRRRRSPAGPIIDA